MLPATPLRAEDASWTNPETGITVALPAPWHADEDGAEGSFSNLAAAQTADFSCLSKRAGVETLADYAAMTLEGLTDYGKFPQAFTPMDDALITFGRLQGLDVPAWVVIGAVGNGFCQIVYADIGEAGFDDGYDPAMTTALFESAAAR